MQTSSRWMIGLAAAILIIGGGVLLVKNLGDRNQSPSSEAPIFYTFANANDGQIARIDKDLGAADRIKFTPDGNYMLVSILTGEVLAYRRDGENWKKQADPVLKIETGFPGFPPEENGLTGIGFAADYDTSHEVFFTYAVRVGEKDFRNRVGRATLADDGTKLTGSNFTQIFEGNVPTDSSHQIQAITGVLVQGKSHALFQLGEGFTASRAQDVTKDGGKLMLIQRDGSDPMGPRPFANQPKIQAVGLRNPPDFEINTFDPEQRIGIVDTGPDHFDRFIYGKFIDLVNGKKVEGIDLGWNGTDGSLTAGRFDPNTPGRPDPQLFRWDPTHTATNIVFHPGKGAIPASTNAKTSVLVNLFGRTGETGLGPDGKPLPGREIWLGDLTLGNAPAITWKPFIIRTEAGIDELGHPIGLERDPKTNDLYFIDILEGSLYQAKLNQ